MRAEQPARRYRDRITELVGVDLDGAACEANHALDTAVVADLCQRLPFPSGSFHRYAERAPRLAVVLKSLERRFPPKLRSTIVARYRGV